MLCRQGLKLIDTLLKKLKILFFAFLLCLTLNVQAGEEEKKDISIGADMVSSYVWRGSYQSGTSIQPAMEFNLGGFSVGVWGSVDIAGFRYKEVDWMASYSIQNFMIGLVDYWVGEEGGYNYFDVSESTAHLLEINLNYSLNRFPLTIGWNTMIAGDALYTKYEKNNQLKKSYPTYIEVTYSFPAKDVNLDINVGVSPWKSSMLYNRSDEGGRTDKFAVVNMALTASKDIRISDKFSLAVFGQLIVNPAKEDIFLVFGIRW